MSPLGSKLVGVDQNVLLLHLPSRITDEWIAPIEAEVRTRLPRLEGAGLILDFQAVELVNSIGITCMLQLEEDCRKRGARLLLAAMPPGIRQFLRQLKLDQRFDSVPSVDDALVRLGVAGR